MGMFHDKKMTGAWLAVGMAVGVVCIASCLWLDQPVAEWARNQPDAWRQAAKFFSKWGIAEYWVLAPALLGMLVYGWLRKNRPNFFLSLFIALAVAASGLLNIALKFGFGRCRPPRTMAGETHEYGFHWLEGTKPIWQSFPSGHTVVAAAGAAALWLIVPRLRPLCILYVVMMMAARVLAGAHYPADVFAGAFLGASFTALLWNQMQKHNAIKNSFTGGNGENGVEQN